MIISSCQCIQYTEQSFMSYDSSLERGERCQNCRTPSHESFFIKFPVETFWHILHVRSTLKKKRLYEICFCFSNFPFFVCSPNSPVCATKQPRGRSEIAQKAPGSSLGIEERREKERKQLMERTPGPGQQSPLAVPPGSQVLHVFLCTAQCLFAHTQCSTEVILQLVHATGMLTTR